MIVIVTNTTNAPLFFQEHNNVLDLIQPPGSPGKSQPSNVMDADEEPMSVFEIIEEEEPMSGLEIVEEQETEAPLPDDGEAGVQVCYLYVCFEMCM